MVLDVSGRSTYEAVYQHVPHFGAVVSIFRGREKGYPTEYEDEGRINIYSQLASSKSMLKSEALAHIFIQVLWSLRLAVDWADCVLCRGPWPRQREVEVLLIDPSCSGSGLPEHHLTAAATGADTENDGRLRRLAAFQKRSSSGGSKRFISYYCHDRHHYKCIKHTCICFLDDNVV